MQLRIALLEDESSQAQLVKNWLLENGYFCHHFATGNALLRKAVNDSFDLFLIDWELPDTNGIEVVNHLRHELNISSPILFTTNRDSEADIVQGLNAGADDYLIKPLRKFELFARIKAVLRRVESVPEENTTIRYSPYTFDSQSETVKLNEETISLTSREFQVALFLFNNAGKVLSRGHILERIWGQRADLNTRTVDTHISLIRQKLHLRPNNGWKLTSIYRHGYRLEQLQEQHNETA